MMVIVNDKAEFAREAERAGGTYLVLKHSTTCPISARAHREVEAFDAEGAIPILKVLVIESRPLSLSLAEEWKIPHASPQTILVKDNQPIWDTSHHHIKADVLREVVADRAKH